MEFLLLEEKVKLTETPPPFFSLRFWLLLAILSYITFCIVDVSLLSHSQFFFVLIVYYKQLILFVLAYCYKFRAVLSHDLYYHRLMLYSMHLGGMVHFSIKNNIFVIFQLAGIEEKHSIKAGNGEHDTTQSSVSPGVVFHNHMQGSSFNLENLDIAPITSLNCAINELLQVDDASSLDSGFFKSTAINKLSVWKGDVLKALETTESEIDKLEGELKLISELQSSCLCPATSSSLAMDYHSKPSNDQEAASDIIPGQSPLELVCSVGNDVAKLNNAMEVDNAESKDEDVYSPATATSKSVEGPLSSRDISPTQLEIHVDCVSKMQTKKSEIEVNSSACGLNEDNGVEVPTTCDGSLVVVSSSSPDSGDINLPNLEVKLCETILASNKEIAKEAAEIFNHLLPTNQCSFDISNTAAVSCLENYPLVKERLFKRKLFMRFKERLISLKFMALQHLWKEDIRSVSIRKFRVKSQKKLDLSLRAVNGGHQKHRLSIRRSSSSGEQFIKSCCPSTFFCCFG